MPYGTQWIGSAFGILGVFAKWQYGIIVRCTLPIRAHGSQTSKAESAIMFLNEPKKALAPVRNPLHHGWCMFRDFGYEVRPTLSIFATHVKLAQGGSWYRLFTTKATARLAQVRTLVTEPTICECDFVGPPCFGCRVEVYIYYIHRVNLIYCKPYLLSAFQSEYTSGVSVAVGGIAMPVVQPSG